MHEVINQTSQTILLDVSGSDRHIDYTDPFVVQENCTYELEVVAALSKL